jgi:hypothetical protein
LIQINWNARESPDGKCRFAGEAGYYCSQNSGAISADGGKPATKCREMLIAGN